MDNLINLLKNIASPIIAGSFAFLLAKYNYTKRHTDKLEISYNHVYYPISKLLKQEKDKVKILNSIKSIKRRYEKYFDRSTLSSIKMFEENMGSKKYYNYLLMIFIITIISIELF